MNKTNKYTISLEKLSGDSFYINTTLSTTNDFAGRLEIIEDEFVSKELRDVVNGIIDYEQRRFRPITPDYTFLDEVVYKIKDETGKQFFFTDDTKLDSDGNKLFGFTEDDIKLRRNNFMKSFLELRFFIGEENKINNSIDIGSRVFTLYLFPNVLIQNIEKPNEMEVSFSVSTPYLIDPTSNLPVTTNSSDGFYLYFFKDLFPEINTNYELFMEAVFNNAKTGKSTNLMTKEYVTSVDQVILNTYTKYILERTDKSDYVYKIDDSKNNINYISSKGVEVNLHPRKII